MIAATQNVLGIPTSKTGSLTKPLKPVSDKIRHNERMSARALFPFGLWMDSVSDLIQIIFGWSAVV